MQNKNTRGVFSPVSVVKPSWMTPDFNPQVDSVFTPISIVMAGSGLSPQTQAGLLRLEQEMAPKQEVVKPLTPQTMSPTTGQVQLPNGQFVTQEQYQNLIKKLKARK